jgi:hypothetical protein
MDFHLVTKLAQTINVVLNSGNIEINVGTKSFDRCKILGQLLYLWTNLALCAILPQMKQLDTSLMDNAI